MKRFIASILAVGTASLLFSQTEPRQKIDVSKLGPQVGDPVSDFNLKDQNGKVRALQSIMGPKGAMLVFICSTSCVLQ